MKRILALTLLAIYLNAAAQPLLPWVSDVLAHTFNWHDHLEHVHHGHIHSHHVSEEMAVVEHDYDAQPVDSHHVVANKDVLSAHLLPEHPVMTFASRQEMNAAMAVRVFHYKNILREVLQPPPDGSVPGIDA